MVEDGVARRPAELSGGRLASAAGWTVVGLVVVGTVRAAAGVGANVFFGADALAWVTNAMAVATIATIVGAAGLSAATTKFVSELNGRGLDADARRFAGFAARTMAGLSVVAGLAAAFYVTGDEVLRSGGAVVELSTGAWRWSSASTWRERRSPTGSTPSAPTPCGSWWGRESSSPPTGWCCYPSPSPTCRRRRWYCAGWGARRRYPRRCRCGTSSATVWWGRSAPRREPASPT